MSPTKIKEKTKLKREENYGQTLNTKKYNFFSGHKKL